MRRAFSTAIFASALTTVAAAQPARFEPAECFAAIRSWAKDLGVECGWLVVPEVRERPAGPNVRLAVARLRAERPSRTPIVLLHGGPGGAGAIAPSTAQRFLTLSAGRTRDVVMYDQRAAGLSEPKLCPEVDRDSALRKIPPSQERWDAIARSCVGIMKTKGMEPAAYTSVVQAADLADLRRAMGYETWDVYGVSYGGRLVFEAIRHDPKGVRAAVAQAAAIPVVAAMTEDPLAVQHAFERVFAACAAQTTCREAFPTLEADFYAVHDSLTKKPLELRLSRPGAPEVRFDGAAYLRSLRCQLTVPRTIPRIPLLVRELQRGDRVRAAQLLTDDCLASSCFVRDCPVSANPVNSLINCHDGYGRQYWDSRAAVATRVKPIFRDFEEGGTQCEIWQQRFADSTDHAPVKSDIPMLLINGEFDERTPGVLVRRAAAGLTRAYFYEMPGESHGVRPSECLTTIIDRFLDDPARAPDATCIAAMPKVVFETKNLAIANFVFVIAGEPASSKFVGRWEAEVPGLPRVFTVDLTTDGTGVSGTLNPNRIAIFDGAISGDTLRFRIRSPDNARTVTFIGSLEGNDISFTRAVEVAPGAPPGGQGILGAQGPSRFIARRASQDR